ncbi:MAG: hypothetical protein COW93_01470, partial [Parcubacteria group bacterium CG22_combo_CG10-13_8_21_14_all_41_9]
QTVATSNLTDKDVDVFLCSSIQPQFNHWVGTEKFEELLADDRLKIALYENEEAVEDVIISKRNNVISFKKDKNEDGTRILWNPETQYDVLIDERLENTDAQSLKECPTCSVVPSNAGVDNEYYKWSFTTGIEQDMQGRDPLLLMSNYPENNQLNVPRSLIFSLDFSEAIDIESVLDENEQLDINHITLQQKVGGSYITAISANVFDVSIRNSSILFGLNDNIQAIDELIGFLNPYTEYRLTIQGIEDLCGRPMQESVIIYFTTGTDVPGVSFVRPSNGYEYACPNTESFIMFNTSMYNIRKDSCAVEQNGNG